MKIHQKTYNQILKKNKKLCPNHAKVLTHISKHTFLKYCEKCLQEGNINSNEIEDIINKKKVAKKIIEEKARKVEELIKAYEEKLEAVNQIEEFNKKLDNAKKIHEILPSYTGQENFKEKIALIKNLNLFEFLNDTEIEEKLNNLNKKTIEIAYVNAFSSAGIEREKRLLSWSDNNGLWLGNAIIRTQVKYGFSNFEFTFQGDSPLEISAIGLGMSYSQKSFIYYYKVIFEEIGGSKKDFILEKNIDKTDNRITTEFSLDTEGFTLYPRKNYKFEAKYEGLNFYSVRLSNTIMLHQKPIFRIKDDSSSTMFCYMKFNLNN